MTVLLAEVVLPFTTGIPRDVAINATHWETASPANDADFLAITNEIDSFFNLEVGEHNVAEFISQVVSRADDACRVRFYDAETTAKVLLAETMFTLGPIIDGAVPFPNEIAACLSLTSTEGAGVIPLRNRRGRMYVGPVNSFTGGSSVIGGIAYPVLSSEFREVLAGAADRMATGPTTVSWSIWSRVQTASFVVTGGFVDNDYDTQRRRQYRATVRTNWGITV